MRNAAATKLTHGRAITHLSERPVNSVRHWYLHVRWRPCFTELHHHCVADESHGDKPNMVDVMHDAV